MTPLETQGRKRDPRAALGFAALQTLYGGPPSPACTPPRIQQLEVAACAKLGRRLTGLRDELETI